MKLAKLADDVKPPEKMKTDCPKLLIGAVITIVEKLSGKRQKKFQVHFYTDNFFSHIFNLLKAGFLYQF